MTVVPNEWLVEMLKGTIKECQKVHHFLDTVEAANILLAIRRKGRLTQKILSAMSDPWGRAKRLRLLLFDSSRVRLVEEHEIGRLPSDLQPPIPDDDVYLVETAYAVRPSRLVTTDRPLRDILQRHADLEISAQLLEEFLSGSFGNRVV